MFQIPGRKFIKAREERLRVVLPARIRMGSAWNDARILNISSRGLLVQTPGPVARGSYVELRKDDHVIVARVMWQDQSRLGLRTQDQVQVEQILSGTKAAGLRLVVDGQDFSEWRPTVRAHDRSRQRGRLFEFGLVAGLAACAAGSAFGVVHEVLAGPLHLAQLALGG